MLLRFHFLLPLLLCWVGSSAQVPTIAWQVSLGGTQHDYGEGLVTTADGGCLLLGRVTSVNGDVVGNHGQSDCWLAKLDAEGGTEWAKCYGGSATESEAHAVQASDGGYVVCVSTNSNNGDVLENLGSYDIWVFKVDAAGTLDWQVSLGGSDEDRARFILAATDGGYLVGGYSASTDGDITGNYGALDVWVAKLDASGNLVWSSNYGGSGADAAVDAIATPDGGYLITADTFSNDGDVTGYHGSSDVWVLKLDAEGALQWQRAFGGSSIEFRARVSLTGSGGYLVTASALSTDGDISAPIGGQDVWSLELDENGNLMSERSFGGTQVEESVAAYRSSDGSTLVTAATRSADGDVSGAHGDWDYWVFRHGTDGELIWQLPLGGSMSDVLFASALAADGGTFLVGTTRSSDMDVIENNGLSDLWVVKLNADPIGVHEHATAAFTIAPNPSTGTVRIDAPEATCNGHVLIKNAIGQTVWSARTAGTTTTLQLEGLANGVYSLEYATCNARGIRSFVLDLP